ncbi:MAG: type II secretion system GspH family protein [Chthoniobacter sp.]|nr:type II secretion system GspH family protein [Chthoniobacter sp.]
MIFHKNRRQTAGFTLVEVIVAMSVFSIFMAGLMVSWTAVQTTAVKALAYSQLQNDQMRVLDYLKRDLRRATKVEIYNGATLVTDTTTFGSELRLTIPDYYADSREEDNTHGPKTPTQPTMPDTSICYGTALTVRFFSLNGAALREEAGISRTVGAATGAFTLSFKNETDGSIRCRVGFLQGRGTLRRQLEVLCSPRYRLWQ